MRWLRRLFQRIPAIRPPHRLDFIEATAAELDRRFECDAGTQFVYNHPASGIPEVIVVLPSGEVVIVEFQLRGQQWADVDGDGFVFVPSPVLAHSLDRLDRHKESNQDKTLRGVFVTDQRVSTPTVLDCYDAGLTILSPLWVDWYEDYGAGCYRAVRWLEQILKLEKKACSDPQKT